MTRCASRPSGTSFNVGVIRGRNFCNAIPTEVVMEVDLRSTTFINLAELNDQLQRALNEATAAAHVECIVQLMGERPSGVTSIETDLVQAGVWKPRVNSAPILCSTSAQRMRISRCRWAFPPSRSVVAAGPGIRTHRGAVRSNESSPGTSTAALVMMGVLAGLR